MPDDKPPDEKLEICRTSDGGVVYCYKTEYKGKNYVHIRKFFTNEQGEEKPTTKGVALLPEAADTLMAALEHLASASD